MILIIDNYDSFVFNLARYVRELGHDCQVRRNDAINLEDIAALSPSHIILSPGPCTPNEAGICLPLVRRFGGQMPILGVCLGHQVIAQAYGGQVQQAEQPMHGKSSAIKHRGRGIFSDLPNPLTVGRYHSLIVTRDALPECLVIEAFDQQGQIMALSHRQYAVVGVQFHPESVMTEYGYDLLANFLGDVR